MRCSKYLPVIAILSGVLCLSSAAYADGVTATGDILPIGTSNGTVLKMSGANLASQFFGPVNVGNTIFNTDGSANVGSTLNAGGIISTPAGVNVNSNAVLYPNGSIFANGSLQSNGVYGSGSHNALNFMGTTYDAGVGTYQPTTGNFYQLIGTYSGWDPTSVYVAGYNAGDTGGVSAARSISLGGNGNGSYPTALVDLIHHKVGIGTTTPQGTLDVQNSTNNATICLNGSCAFQIPLFLAQNSINMGDETMGSVHCKTISYTPWNGPVVATGNVYYDPGAGAAWTAWVVFFREMNPAAGTGTVCMDSGGYKARIGSENISYVIMPRSGVVATVTPPVITDPGPETPPVITPPVTTGGGGGGGCFLPDALVTLADGSTKEISKLEIGEAVKGHTQINHVTKLPTYKSSQAVYGFNGGKKFVTGGHPFYTANGWEAIDPSLTPKEKHNVKTTKLKVGDVLLLDTGKPFTVKSIEREDSGEHDIYNPTLDGDHTYYSDGLLVHNKKAVDDPVGGGGGGGGDAGGIWIGGDAGDDGDGGGEPAGDGGGECYEEMCTPE